MPRKPALLYFVILVLFALNHGLLSPFLLDNWGVQAWTLGIPVALRLIALFGLSWALVKFYGAGRGRAIRNTWLMAAVDQILLKGAILLIQVRIYPDQWQGVELKTPLFALLMAFLAFTPVVLILAFGGAELGMHKKHPVSPDHPAHH